MGGEGTNKLGSVSRALSHPSPPAVTQNETEKHQRHRQQRGPGWQGNGGDRGSKIEPERQKLLIVWFF